ncbi:MAG: hypothetical protein M3460_03825 [Actinomycetota bacterium]|nr:hypothetical protein [Actinomycetota bacterium]
MLLCLLRVAAALAAVFVLAGAPTAVVARAGSSPSGCSSTSTEPGFAARFDPARAYSAQAEVIAAPQRAELVNRVVPPTAARLPWVAQALGVDRSAEQWDMELIHAPQARTINRSRPEILVGVLDWGSTQPIRNWPPRSTPPGRRAAYPARPTKHPARGVRARPCTART